MIIKQKTVGSMAVCCYVLGCEETKKGVVIDPGGDETTILNLCEKEGLDIEYIIATHAHPDHVCGNKRIQDETGAKIIMHADEEEWIQQDNIKQYFAMLGLAFSPPADILVHDGDTITFGKQSLDVFHTPGHTPGGICLYNGTDVFTGDTLFVGAIGRTDFPGGNMGAFMKSIGEKLLVLPDDTVVWPGHGYGGSQSTIGEEKRSNPYISGA